MKKKRNLLFLCIAVSLFFISCIKDTDFDQTDDIEITPIVELDFLFFNLNSTSFSDLGVDNLIVSDTTNFDFLNDEFIVDNLLRADFYFKYTNSFSVDFISEIKFLDENNELHYTLSIPINSGSESTPVITEFTEIIETEDLSNLTMADKVIINIIASSPVDNLEGALKLQSKTTYYLKIIQ